MRTSLAIACLLALAACAEKVDKDAKKRIFSPEDPPQAVARASEKLPPEDVADKPAVARRVLGMGAAEATERIGAHEYSATLTFEWMAESKTLRLQETRKILAGPGGVEGDFHGIVDNSHDQGLEVLRVHQDVFAKSKYGKFRQRKRDRGMAERMREQIYGAIPDVDALFLDRMKLTAQGTTSVESRTAWKYTVQLGPEQPKAADALPPRAAPKNGVDDTTLRRLHFYDARVPKTLSGTVLVDAKTSVVLKANLDGRLTVSKDGKDSELHLVLDAQLSNIGRDPLLKTPKEFLPDEDKPSGIADALERFGIPKRGRDGGVQLPTSPTSDDDDTP